MKSLYSRLLNSILSIVTTFLLIASPVAAIVYAAEPVSEYEDYKYKEEKIAVNQRPEFLVSFDRLTNKVNKLKPGILDDTISSALTGLKNHMQDHKEGK